MALGPRRYRAEMSPNGPKETSASAAMCQLSGVRRTRLFPARMSAFTQSDIVAIQPGEKLSV